MTAILSAYGIGYDINGRTILNDLDFSVAAGERVAVMGPSGSGKTTLLSIVAGLTRPTRGEVTIDGFPITANSRLHTGIALVLQGYGLVSLLTAAENIEVALRSCGRSPKDARQAAADALAAVGLADKVDKLIEELSGGQQQRAAVARALAFRPKVIVADEPTAEQDAVSRSMVLERMLGVTDYGGALLIATHDPEVAKRCDRIVEVTKTGVTG